MTTILAQPNEHTIPLVFDKTNTKEAPKKEKRTCTTDDYNAINVVLDDHGTLSPELAKAFIEVVYESQYWYMAPVGAGIFTDKEDALAFVDTYPNHPISIVVETNSNAGAVSVLVNSNENGYLFRDEYHLDLIESNIKKAGDIMLYLQMFMTERAKYDHNSNKCIAYPFVPK